MENCSNFDILRSQTDFIVNRQLTLKINFPDIPASAAYLSVYEFLKKKFAGEGTVAGGGGVR